MDCPICKSENDPRNKFCTVCGIRFSDVNFINNIDFQCIKPDTSGVGSRSIQISNTTVHGGISLEGKAYGRDEGFYQKFNEASELTTNKIEKNNIEELRIKVRETTEKDLIREAIRARDFSGAYTLRQGMNLIDFALRARKVLHEND